MGKRSGNINWFLLIQPHPKISTKSAFQSIYTLPWPTPTISQLSFLRALSSSCYGKIIAERVCNEEGWSPNSVLFFLLSHLQKKKIFRIIPLVSMMRVEIDLFWLKKLISSLKNQKGKLDINRSNQKVLRKGIKWLDMKYDMISNVERGKGKEKDWSPCVLMESCDL